MKMQDKEVLEQAEEALKSVGDFDAKKDAKDLVKERRNSVDDQGKKEQTKDGKFVFRKMKQPKKERSEKKKLTRFEHEGVSFKAKLIGVEAVPEPRGDKMSQETMQRLKLNVRNLGPHKRKVIVSVSFQGIKVKDDKTGELIYHHPVALISFISQDITDARAFGYVASSSIGLHQFIAIKTEKPAFNVVVALRDLFQTVLDLKQQKMDQVKEKKVDDADTSSSVGSDSIHEKTSVQDNVADSVSSVSEEEKSIKGENIYFDVILTEPFHLKEDEGEVQNTKSVDELLGLQDELNKLQQGIEQMDTSIAAAANSLGVTPTEKDPFDTSFVTPGGTKIDAFVQPMPVPVTTSAHVIPSPSTVVSPQSLYEDKYAAFSKLNSEPSIFEGTADSTELEDTTIPELKELEEEIRKKSTMPPAKPPRNVKTPTPDLSVFADLDPLGKDRPYKDKAEFFQDVKNPPKKVLNDLVDKNNGDEFSCRAFENQCGSPVFPASPPSLASSSSSPYNTPGFSSSLPNSFLGNLKFSVACPNGLAPFNPFEGDNQTQSFNGSHIPPHPSAVLSQNSISSSPIPIPCRQNLDAKHRTYSNGSLGSPCSRSPMSTDYDSPLGNNHTDISDTTLSNGLHEERPNVLINPPSYTNGYHDKNSNATTNLKQNGVSRPRPRPSISNKGSSMPSNGLVLQKKLHSIPPPEYDSRSRENLQSISNALKTNGYTRNRAVSVPVENMKDYRVNGNIFANKPDPFADDFFYSLSKKVANGHLTKTEIRDYV